MLQVIVTQLQRQWGRGEGACFDPLSPALSPLVPRGERGTCVDTNVLRLRARSSGSRPACAEETLPAPTQAGQCEAGVPVGWHAQHRFLRHDDLVEEVRSPAASRTVCSRSVLLKACRVKARPAAGLVKMLPLATADLEEGLRPAGRRLVGRGVVAALQLHCSRATRWRPSPLGTPRGPARRR